MTPPARATARPFGLTPEPIDPTEFNDPAVRDEAWLTLARFLDDLYGRRYDQAAAAYGGRYEPLRALAGLTDEATGSATWQALCDSRILLCELPSRLPETTAHTPTSFEFLVAFSNPDASTFMGRPCCTLGDADDAPQTQFAFFVFRAQGQLWVIGAPPLSRSAHADPADAPFTPGGDLAAFDPAWTPEALEPIDLNDEPLAQALLQRFFDLLYAREYADAARLFGDDYRTLWPFTNFEVAQGDATAIWRNVCERRALQCLPVQSIRPGMHTERAFEFIVTFENPDGSTFTRGPCCGGNATDQPPISEFRYTVVESGGRLWATGAPPLMP